MRNHSKNKNQKVNFKGVDLLSYICYNINTMQDSERRLRQYLNKESNEKDIGRQTQLELYNEALSLSTHTSLNLRTIVDALTEHCYKKFKTLSGEFNRSFSKNNAVAEILIASFLKKLEAENVNIPIEPGDPALLSARKDLLEFIQDYAKDTGKTVAQYLEETVNIQYPYLNTHALFNKEVRDQWAGQISTAAEKIAEGKYAALFAGDPKGFILDFFFTRVIPKSENGEVRADRNSLEGLLSFLDGKHYELENLYELLYEEFRSMSSIGKNKAINGRIAGTRDSINATGTGVELVSDSAPFIKDNFDFDKFFNAEVVPVIKSLRLARMPKNGLMRACDVTRISPEGIAQSIYPNEAMKPMAEKTAIMENSEKAFIEECRKYFNYAYSANGEISDDLVKATLSDQLGKVKDQIEYTISKALTRKSPTDAIRESCKFLDEIINCRNLDELFKWLVNPVEFINKFPKHKNIPYKIISHQARTMIMMLLFYRKNIFDEKFRSIGQQRTMLEGHFVKMLNIRKPQKRSIAFRVAVEIDAETMKPALFKNEKGDMVPRYRIIREQSLLNKDKNLEIIREIDGKIMQIFPVETKEFQAVKVDIPNGKDGKPLTTTLYIYSGDGNLIHCKKPESFISSLLRGKQPTDLLRWMIVTDSQEDNDALRSFLYENYSSGYFDSIKDNLENRNLYQKTGSKIRTKGSRLLSGIRGFAGSMFAMIPSLNGEGKVEHQSIGFETQIFDLETMLIYNLSDHTASSHKRIYTPEREYANMFKYFFPPIIYGRKFAEYKRKGFM